MQVQIINSLPKIFYNIHITFSSLILLAKKGAQIFLSYACLKLEWVFVEDFISGFLPIYSGHCIRKGKHWITSSCSSSFSFIGILHWCARPVGDHLWWAWAGWLVIDTVTYSNSGLIDLEVKSESSFAAVAICWPNSNVFLN